MRRGVSVLRPPVLPVALPRHVDASSTFDPVKGTRAASPAGRLRGALQRLAREAYGDGGKRFASVPQVP